MLVFQPLQSGRRDVVLHGGPSFLTHRLPQRPFHSHCIILPWPPTFATARTAGSVLHMSIGLCQEAQALLTRCQRSAGTNLVTISRRTRKGLSACGSFPYENQTSICC